jgi:hypothetical protein
MVRNIKNDIMVGFAGVDSKSFQLFLLLNFQVPNIDNSSAFRKFSTTVIMISNPPRMAEFCNKAAQISAMTAISMAAMRV